MPISDYPWKLDIEPDNDFAWIWNKGKTEIIVSKPLNYPNSRANITLVVAAPELLAACQSVLLDCLYEYPTLRPDTIEMLQNVIAKATYQEETPEPALEDDPEKLGLTDKIFGDQ